MIIAVLPNLDKRGSSQVVENLGLLLKKEGIEAYLPDTICSPNFKTAPEDELFRIADYIITIGGDGTIIRYAKRAAVDNKPILGINAGRLGYLADVEQNELKLISKLKTNEFTLEDRMMLSVEIYENGKLINTFDALNDAVITSGFISRIIDISVSVSNDTINYLADGLIVSTPTGSTAYSMSAGGPIIDPGAQCVCITPICSHSLSAKPILLGGNKTITLKSFSKKRTEIYLTVDGRKVCNVKPYTEIKITKSKNTVKLIRLNEHSFYKTLSAKFKDGRSF
ncbi:MAG: NAD(+)/NADH kinase [Clostridia bacterium]|nr:NAD(+)/NADH kinase [Clostridia bacterium]